MESYTDGPAVIAGDFNSLEVSPLIMELSSHWDDSYRTLHPDDPGLTCCIDNLSNGPEEPLEKRIDYIFLIPKDSQVISAIRVFDQPFRSDGGWQWASDHIGLMVEFEP